MTVFVTQDTQHDTRDLLRFSPTVRFLATRSVYPDEADERLLKMSHWATVVLQDFDPTTDYIALAGDPVLVAMGVTAACAQASKLNCPFVNLLKWDGQERSYYPVRFLYPRYHIGVHQHGETEA